jgi:hypothetical protein
MSSPSLDNSKAVRLSQVIFFLLALTMAVFSLLTLRYGTPLWVAALMALDALLLVCAGWFITRSSPTIFLLAILLVCGNILATMMDQFGWVDAIVLLAFMAQLVLLVTARRQLTKG